MIQGLRSWCCLTTRCEAVATCIDATCSSYPLICHVGNCQCQAKHVGHAQISFSEFISKVCRQSQPPIEVNKVQMAVGNLFDSIVSDFRKFESTIKLLLNELSSQLYGSETDNDLRQALMTKQQPTARVMTGTNMHHLLMAEPRKIISVQDVNHLEALAHTTRSSLLQHLIQLQVELRKCVNHIDADLGNRNRTPPNQPTNGLFKVETVAQAKDMGFEQSIMKFGETTMTTDRHLTICDKEKHSVVVLGIPSKETVAKFPVNNIAACLLDHSGTLLAVRTRIQSQDSKDVVSFFHLTNKSLVAETCFSEKIVFWKWANEEVLAVVTTRAVYHIKIGFFKEPEMMFERRGMLIEQGVQIIDYVLDFEVKWAALTGVFIKNGQTVRGAIQLSRAKTQQLIEGFACTFSHVMIGSRQALIFSFVENKHNESKFKLIINEIQVPADSQRHKQNQDVNVAENDFPLALVASWKYGQLYMITKLGWLEVFNAVTANPILRISLSEQPVLLAVGCSEEEGVQVVSRSGKVIRCLLNEQQLVQALTNCM